MKLRYSLICAITLFFICMLTTQSYAKIDPKTIVGMWLFDEGSGNTTKDWSGNGLDGKLQGPKWIDGKFGKALNFGGSDYVEIGDDPVTDPGGTKILSITAWVKRANDTAKLLVAIRRSPGGYVLGVGILGAATNQVKMTKYAIVDIYLGNFPQDTNWHHIAGVWHDKGQIVYVDGAVNGEAADTANFSAALSGKLLLGGDTGDQGFSSGIIDDVAIFKTVLAENDVKEIMNKGLGKATGIMPVSPKGRLATFWGEIKVK
ncbi:MAG: LamG domain-containing protein [Candidatus Poribacteria bacterium]